MATGGHRGGGGPADDDPMKRLADIQGNAMRHGRDRFKAPKFDGSSDVELFIQQFGDVRRANGWDDGAALLNLRESLTGKATECGRGNDTALVFAALRSRFGLSQRQARDKLAGLKRDPKKGYQELADEVELLVNLAYPDMGVGGRLDLALYSFSKELNNKVAQRHLLAVPPASLAGAVRTVEEFLQVGSDVRSPHNLAGVESEAGGEGEGEEDSTKAMLRTLMEAIKSNTTMPQETLKMNASVSQGATTQHRWTKPQYTGKQQTDRKSQVTCYGCGESGHYKRDCPKAGENVASKNSGNDLGSQ